MALCGDMKICCESRMKEDCHARIESPSRLAQTNRGRHLDKNAGEIQSNGSGSGGTSGPLFVESEYFIGKLEGSATEPQCVKVRLTRVLRVHYFEQSDGGNRPSPRPSVVVDRTAHISQIQKLTNRAKDYAKGGTKD